ncbi:MAG: S-layer family protein, partial [Hydrogenophaga sp.]
GVKIANRGTDVIARTEVTGQAVHSVYDGDDVFSNPDRLYSFSPYKAVQERGQAVNLARSAGGQAIPAMAPPSALFKVAPDPQSTVLIATDPLFANGRQWLGSDHLLSALALDFGQLQKRLGDGFYEQRLIREQVGQLTGQRFLGDYRDDEAQFLALMNAGLTFAHKVQLRPGIALSAEQMAALTSDIVWLETEEVTLPDGRKEKALVPRVYLAPRSGDLSPSGALIAGNTVNIHMSGDVLNSGTVAGRQLVQVQAGRDIEHSGTITTQGTAVLSAGRDIAIQGGEIRAVEAIVLDTGRDLSITSTTRSTTTPTSNGSGTSSFERTGIDRQARLYVSGEAGVILAQVGRDVTLTAADIRTDGADSSVAITAGRDLTLNTVRTSASDDIHWDAENRQRTTRSQDVGSRIESGGDNASYEASSVGGSVGVGSQLGNSGAGVGSDKGSNSSTTVAAISGIAGNKAARTGDTETSLAPIFDKQKVRDEVEAQVVITKAFGQQAVKASATYADAKAIELRRQDNEAEARKWDEGGEYRVALHAAVGALGAGVAGAVGAAAGATLVPVLGEEIAGLNLSEPVRQAVTQVVGVAVGVITGGTAGAATSLNQTAHNYVSHSPFAEVRRTVSQENARLTNACGAGCTAQDFQRIDQQMAALEQAGNLAEIAQRGGMTTPQAQQMAQLLLELAPVYGSGESMLQLITGQSSLTGEEASRVWAAIGIIPVAGGILKKVGEPSAEALQLAIKELTHVLDAVAAQKAQQQRMGELRQLFNKQDSFDTLPMGGKSYTATTNPAGTTKTFDTSGIPAAELEQQVFAYAGELAGGAVIEPVMRNGAPLPGRWAAKLEDGTTINVRSVSSSNVSRWTVDVQASPALKDIKPSFKDNSYELKFR